jgi:hypothetical protein
MVRLCLNHFLSQSLCIGVNQSYRVGGCYIRHGLCRAAKRSGNFITKD